MASSINRVKITLFFQFVIISQFILVACDGGVAVGAISPTAAATLTPTPDCPPSNSSLDDIRLITIVPNNIIFLVDLDYTKDYSFTESGDSFSQDVFNFLEWSLPTFVEPGDRYSLFRMGFRSYADSRIDRFESSVIYAPDIPPTPSSPSDYSPLATYTPDPNLGTVARVSAKNQFAQEQAAHEARATQEYFQFLCQNTEWIEQFGQTEDDWDATRQAEIALFRERFVAGVQMFLSVSSLEAEMGTRVVFDGLSHSSVDIKNACNEYSRCILIIIDDMDEYRVDQPYTTMSFENTEIVTIMLHCSDIYDPSAECAGRQERWTQFFKDTGAVSLTFANGEVLGEFLADFIHQKELDQYRNIIHYDFSGGN